MICDDARTRFELCSFKYKGIQKIGYIIYKKINGDFYCCGKKLDEVSATEFLINMDGFVKIDEIPPWMEKIYYNEPILHKPQYYNAYYFTENIEYRIYHATDENNILCIKNVDLFSFGMNNEGLATPFYIDKDGEIGTKVLVRESANIIKNIIAKYRMQDNIIFNNPSDGNFTCAFNPNKIIIYNYYVDGHFFPIIYAFDCIYYINSMAFLDSEVTVNGRLIKPFGVGEENLFDLKEDLLQEFNEKNLITEKRSSYLQTFLEDIPAYFDNCQIFVNRTRYQGIGYNTCNLLSIMIVYELLQLLQVPQFTKISEGTFYIIILTVLRKIESQVSNIAIQNKIKSIFEEDKIFIQQIMANYVLEYSFDVENFKEEDLKDFKIIT